MNTVQFNQYQKCLTEIAKLHELCGTEMMDSIQDMLTDDQYDTVGLHSAIDALRV